MRKRVAGLIWSGEVGLLGFRRMWELGWMELMVRPNGVYGWVRIGEGHDMADANLRCEIMIWATGYGKWDIEKSTTRGNSG